MIISEYDKSKITEVLSKQDIYHITSLPWKVAASDCGSKQIEFDTALRHKWMYSETGFFQSLDDYSNTFKLIDNYLNNGDAPYTLRQRINIVNELFDCDFKSNLPVHVSFKPRTELDSNTTINLSDDSINNYPSFQITNEHMLDVASKVHFTITFWTSGAIDCYLLGVPVIEYYDPNKFPRGQVLENKIFTSIYRKLNIVSPANNEKELIKALKDLIKRNYKLHSNKPHPFYNKLLVRSNKWEKKIENILLSHNFINKKY